MNNDEVVFWLAKDGVGVLPTDTLYGLVGRALSEKAVLRIYELKDRQSTKPFIVLISDLSDLNQFGVSLDASITQSLEKIWPGPVSVILPCGGEFEYLHRGTGKLAFRMPDDEVLRALLRKTGPLVAPSANTEGAPPARNIAEAKKYFGERVDFYVDGGELGGEPSTLVEWSDGGLKVIRPGAGKI